MTTKTFDPDQLVVTYSGVPMGGWAPDEILRVEQQEDSFVTVQGADGEVCRVKTNAKWSIVTLRLLQSSDSNDVLSAAHTLDVETPNGAGIVPFSLADLTGRSLLVAAECWVIKPANLVYSRGVEVREWQLALADPVGLIGGN